MEARVLELDVRVGLSEGLEGPLVAVAGEGVDDDLAFLFGRGDYQRPVRGGSGRPGDGSAAGESRRSAAERSRLEEPAPADPGRARYDVAVFASRHGLSPLRVIPRPAAAPAPGDISRTRGSGARRADRARRDSCTRRGHPGRRSGGVWPGGGPDDPA